MRVAEDAACAACLHALLGVGGDVIALDSRSGAFAVSRLPLGEWWEVDGVSAVSLLECLNAVCAAARDALRLERFHSEATCERSALHAMGSVMQALGAWIGGVHQAFVTEVNRILRPPAVACEPPRGPAGCEPDVAHSGVRVAGAAKMPGGGPGCSLLALVTWLRPRATVLSSLVTVIAAVSEPAVSSPSLPQAASSHAVRVLDFVWEWQQRAEALCSSSRCGVLDASFHCLVAVLEPYGRLVDQWISEGSVHDEWRELDMASGRAPAIFRGCATELLAAGDAMSMLRAAAARKGRTFVWCDLPAHVAGSGGLAAVIQTLLPQAAPSSDGSAQVQPWSPFTERSSTTPLRSALPLHMQLERSVSTYVKDRHRFACGQLMLFCKEELSLLQHFQCIRAVFCFGAGYRLEGFTGPLFTHLREDRLADVQDSHLLTQWLRQALLQDADTPGTSESAPASGPAAARRRRRSSATLSVGLGSRWSAAGGRPLVGGAAAALLSPPRERVSLPSTPKSCYTGMSPGTSVTGTVAAGPAAMFAVDVRSSEVACVHVRIVGADASSPQRFLRAGLALEYDLEWPLTHVFHDSVLEKYASVWRLLLLVKYVKSTLDELHHANRHVEAKIMASLRLVDRRWIAHIPQQLHKLRLGLHLIMHFTNGLHAYLMNKAAFCDWSSLYRSVDAAGSLAEVMRVHGEFLEELRKSLLLGESMRIARREVEGLLDSAEHFAGLYRAYHIQAARTIRQFAEVYPSARASDTSVSQLLGDDFSDAATTVHSTSTGTSGVVLCSTLSDRLRERFQECMQHTQTFRKVVGVCLAVMQERAATSPAASHLNDILVTVNFNSFHRRTLL